MKKWFGMVCSAVAGIFGFIGLSLDCWCNKYEMTVMGAKISGTGKSSGWDIIKDGKDVDGVSLYKIFAILLLVVSVLLIVSAVVLLLRNLGVLKLNFNMDLINNILLSVFVVCIIVMLIALGIMSHDSNYKLGDDKLTCYAGIGSWLTLAVGAVACSLSWAFNEKTK